MAYQGRPTSQNPPGIVNVDDWKCLYPYVNRLRNSQDALPLRCPSG